MKSIKFLIAPLLASLLAITGGQSMAAEQITQREQGQKMGRQMESKQERRGMQKKPSRGQRTTDARRMMPAFADFDLNGDGKITEAEFNEARTARISQRAKDGRQMRGLADAPAFEELDANGDGSISREEFAAAMKLHQQQSEKQQGRRGTQQNRGRQ